MRDVMIIPCPARVFNENEASMSFQLDMRGGESKKKRE
jgi:hypothetical protein